MKVVTTCHKAGFDLYGHRWLDGIKHWPAECVFYPEGFKVDLPGKDVAELADLTEWKKRFVHYEPPAWRWDVVKYAHKVFVAHDAFRDYDGVGVWLDADCVTFRDIPEGLVESELGDAYIAHYGRTGHYTETGMWIVNCAHPAHKDFFSWWLQLYHSGNFTRLPEWHDCMTLDAAIKRFTFKNLITTKNLSGEFHLDMHPQSKAKPFCDYVDHCKGERKTEGRSPENSNR